MLDAMKGFLGCDATAGAYRVVHSRFVCSGASHFSWNASVFSPRRAILKMPREYFIFILNHGPCRRIVLPDGFKFGHFMDAVEEKTGVSAAALQGVEFRWVNAEPDEDHADRLFKDFEARKIKSTSSLSQDGVVYIVGKLAEGE